MQLPAIHYPNHQFQLHQGIGLTSQRRRDKMVLHLMQHHGLMDAAVIAAMRVTPRHFFVDEALASRAYEESALPIGFGQTISQPAVVATMTQALLANLKPKRVLEIGTGSGYQTAILSLLVPQLWTVERIGELQHQAKRKLDDLQLINIHYRLAGAVLGWPEIGSFDAILSAAAPNVVPESLLAQLTIGGRLVMPVGGQQGLQQLLVIDRTKEGFLQRSLGQVSFVPLVTDGSL